MSRSFPDLEAVFFFLVCGSSDFSLTTSEGGGGGALNLRSFSIARTFSTLMLKGKGVPAARQHSNRRRFISETFRGFQFIICRKKKLTQEVNEPFNLATLMLVKQHFKGVCGGGGSLHCGLNS